MTSLSQSPISFCQEVGEEEMLLEEWAKLARRVSFGGGAMNEDCL